jgi:predicted nucleic acid-binding protein
LILLDTTVLSAVLRRRRRGTAELRLSETVAALLASEAPIGIPGIVFQEVLSGIADAGQTRRLLSAIRGSFPILLATERDHIRAAGLVSAAAGRGIALSTPDALIAAQSIAFGAALFTTDADFRRLTSFSELTLFS